MRTEILIGKVGIELLRNSKIIVFGVGGVGGYVVEALARAGIGELHLVDYDTVDITNVNRQIIALETTVGQNKVDVFEERIKSINPECKVKIHNKKLELNNYEQFFNEKWDYMIDAIDTISSKILLAQICEERKIPLMSSMGMANKFEPLKLKVADINDTNTCPLARVIRKKLRRLGIQKLKVVFSEEDPIKPPELKSEINPSGQINGTMSFVPATAGLIIASEIINDILKRR